MEDLHHRLSEALAEAISNGTGLAGCQIDVMKGFERVDPILPMHILKNLECRASLWTS